MNKWIGLWCIGMSSVLWGQNKISGLVLDSESKEALQFASVFLVTMEDSMTPLYNTYTDAHGYFKLDNVITGDYKIKTAYISYYNGSSQRIHIGDNDKLDVGQIYMRAKSEALKEVVINEFRPVVEIENDKLIYNAESDAGNKTSRAIDLLQKVPYITIENDDNIKVNGTANFKVLLNGKQTSIITKNPKEALKAFPASSIKRVEVITDPGAKYDAEGAEAVINIITTSRVGGVNGTIEIGVNSLLGINSNTSLNVKSGNFGLSVYYGLNTSNYKSISTSEYHRIVPGNILNQYSSLSGKNKSFSNWGDFELSYDFDSTKSLSFYGNISGGKSKYTGIGNSAYTDENADTTNQGSVNSYSNSRYPEIEYGFDFIRKFDAEENEVLTLSVNQNVEFSSDESSAERLYHPNPEEFYIKKSNDDNLETTFEVAYTKPLGELNEIGVGSKMIIRDISTRLYQSLRNDSLADVSALPGIGFNYHQNVYAAYTEFNTKVKKWSFKFGLRGERTILWADFQQSSSNIHHDYFSFIPSLSIKTSINKKHNLKFSYSKRIQRPWIDYLDPAIENSDYLSASYGNSQLTPEIKHRFQIEYSTFGKWGFFSNNLYYWRNAKGIEQYSFFNEPFNRIDLTYGNIGLEKSVGDRINFSLKLLDNQLSIYLGPYLQYTSIKNTKDSLQVNSGWEYNAYTNVSYKITKSLLSSFGGYLGRNLNGLQSKNKGYYGYWFYFSKTFREKITLGLMAMNFLKKYKVSEGTTTDITYTSSYYMQTYQRSLKVSLFYRFGKLKEEVSRKKGVINDDIKPGGEGDH